MDPAMAGGPYLLLWAKLFTLLSFAETSQGFSMTRLRQRAHTPAGQSGSTRHVALNGGPDGHRAEVMPDALGNGHAADVAEPGEHFLRREHTFEEFQVFLEDRLRLVEYDQH